MEPKDWPKIKLIFDSAVLVRKEQRSAYVKEACGDDADLLREVEALLASFDAAEGFMETPFAGEIARMLVGAEADEIEPNRELNHYKIVRRIGAGGMGKVYLAQDNLLKRQVAIKVLSAEATSDPDQLSRFVQEARFASVLNHPNILTIYEIGQAGDLHFISTEFVPGETLRTRLDQKRFSVREAVAIAIDVASALAIAHQSDIVHRDIKPENIMLREDGLVKVVDFGLAKLNRNERLAADRNADTWGDVRTEPGSIMGTVTYMSPEQASGTEVDARTDVWSLGAVLYEMIVGQAPFKGSTPAGVMTSILKVEPKPITHSSPNLRRLLRKIIGKSLAKAVDDRYKTMQEMLEDLNSCRVEIETGVAEPRRVAILPFTNVTRDAHMGFFEFALADAVITELARSHSLVVRPSSSVAKYLGTSADPLAIGRELKVDAVLAANFLVSKKRIRVTAQLIDVGDRNVLWGDQIDSDADDIIGLQDTITNRIVDGLKCELDTSVYRNVAVPVTNNSVAYMEYLRGRDQLRRYMFHTVANENVEIAIEHFQRAIDLDPTFALAYCALGTCYMQRVVKVVGSRADIEAASVSLDHALEQDPQLIDARAYRSFILRLEGETQRSREKMSELRRDAPNNFEVHYLSAACYRFDGDYENAFRSYEEMLRIDPTARVAVHYCRARIFWYQEEFENASEELALAEKIEPNHPIVKFFHAILIFQSGDPASAANEMEKLLSTYPYKGFRPYLSMCLSALGRCDDALSELSKETELIAEVDPDVSYWLASANLMAGKTDRAFEWLERSIRLGNHNLPWFNKDPILAPMRADPRYAELVSPLRQRRSAEIH